MTVLPSVSVAMATHNGAEFVLEQLASISTQTHLPVELVVCDDASTDKTCDRIEEFASSSPFTVRLRRNEVRLGPCRNFLQAARMCRADLIAFCDQDDVWRGDKLEKCAWEFSLDPQVTMVMHSGRVFGTNASGRPPRYPAYRRRVVASPANFPMNASFPGFAQVFHHDLVRLDPGDEVLGRVFPGRAPEHDSWVGLLATAFGKVVLLPDDLAWYRQHGGNMWGAPASDHPAGVVARSLGWAGNRGDLLRTAEAARARAELIEKLAPEVLGLADSPDVARARAARVRAALWRRSADVAERRTSVYAGDAGRTKSMRTVWVNALRGDYGSRRKGRSGLRSMVRDFYHVTRIGRRGSRSGVPTRDPISEESDS